MDEVSITCQISISIAFRHSRRGSRFYYPVEYRGSKAVQQRQTSGKKEAIEPANVQIRPIREEDDAISRVGAVCFAAPRPDSFREKFGSAPQGAGTNPSLVTEVLTSISQFDCKEHAA